MGRASCEPRASWPVAISCLWLGDTIGTASGQPEAAWLIAIGYRQSGVNEKERNGRGISALAVPLSCRSAVSNQTTCSRLRGSRLSGSRLAPRFSNHTEHHELLCATGCLACGYRLAVNA